MTPSPRSRVLDDLPSMNSGRATAWGCGVPDLAERDATGARRYRFGRVLGDGTAGRVYEAIDTELHVPVAVKVMEAAADREGALQSLFASLVDVAHPNLVSLHELTRWERGWVLSMERVEGRDLRRRLHTESALDPRTLARWLLGIARGLFVLHGTGLVHGDLKATNVVVEDETDRAVIVDSGLRVALEDGEPLWEVHREHSRTPDDDWRALGLLVYEACTGRPPSWDSGAQPTTSARRTGLSASLGTLATALVATDSQTRPRPSDVIAKLAGLAGETVAARVVAPPRQRPAPLIGRKPELHELERALQSAREGRSVLARVRGDDGSGKTAVCRRFIESIDPDITVVLGARCSDSGAPPYSTWSAIATAAAQAAPAGVRLDPLTEAAVARCFGPLRSPSMPLAEAHDNDPEVTRRRAWSGMRTLLDTAAGARPLVVWIDDAHGLDLDEQQLLKWLLAHPPTSAFVVLLAERDGSVIRTRAEHPESDLTHLDDFDGGLTDAAQLRISLGALDNRSALRLAWHELGPVAGPERARGVLEAARGNASAVAELAAFSRSHPERSAPASLDELLAARWERLDGVARRLVAWLAFARRPMPRDALLEALGDPSQTHAALERARAERWISATPSADSRLELHRRQFGEWVRRALDATERRELRSAMVRTLATWPEVGALELARHREAAGERAGAACDYAQAARQAEHALAFDRAATCYARALAQDGQDAGGISQLELRIRRAACLGLAGRGSEAAAAYQAAAREAPPEQALAMREAAAVLLLSSGQFDAAMRSLVAVLADSGIEIPDHPVRVVLSIAGARMRTLMKKRRARSAAGHDQTELRIKHRRATDAATTICMADPLRGAALHAKAAVFAAALECPEARSITTAGSIVFEAASGPSARVERLREALDRELDAGIDPHIAARCRIAHAISRIEIGRFAEGDTRGVTDLAELKKCGLGGSWEAILLGYFLVFARFYRGRFVGLRQLVVGARESARRRGNVLRSMTMTHHHAVYAWLAADEPSEAMRLLHATRSQWIQRSYGIVHYRSTLAETAIRSYRGEAAAAWEQLRDETASLSLQRFLWPQGLEIDFLSVRGRLALAAFGQAGSPYLLEVAHKCGRQLLRKRTPWSEALGALVLAGCEAGRGRPEAARHWLLRGAACCRTQGLQGFAAAADRQRGRLEANAAGQRLVQAADWQLQDAGARLPERIADVLVPIPRLRPRV